MYTIRERKEIKRKHSIKKIKKKQPKIKKIEEITKPEKTKGGREYKFYMKNNDILQTYIDILRVRYCNDLAQEYNIHWNVITNNTGNVNLQIQIKVREKKRRNISNIDVDTEPRDLQTLYVITVHKTALTIMIHGKMKDQWVEQEYPLLKDVYLHTQQNQTKSIIESYNHILGTNIAIDKLNKIEQKTEARETGPGGDLNPRRLLKYFEKAKENILTIEKSEEVKKNVDHKGEKYLTDLKDNLTTGNTQNGEDNINEDDSTNIEKLVNIEKAVTEMSEELTFWINTYKEDKEKFEEQLKDIMEQVITLLIKGNRDLKYKVERLADKMKKQNVEINKLKTQSKNRIKQNKNEFKNVIGYLTEEINNIKNRMEEISKDQTKTSDKVKTISTKTENNEYPVNSCHRQFNNDISISADRKEPNEDEKRKILVLMDSNRTNTPFYKLFPKKTVTVIPCGSIKIAKDILNLHRMDLKSTHDVLLDVGANDLEVSDPEIVAEELCNVAKEFNETSQCKTYVSTLTTERNNLKSLVDVANALIQHTLSLTADDNVVLINPDKINEESKIYYDEEKHKKQAICKPLVNRVAGIEILCMNLQMNLKASVDGRYNDDQFNEIRNELMKTL